MKHFYLLVCLVLLGTAHAQTTNDTIFFWKAGVMLAKRSIKPIDLDSITFKRPVVLPVTMPSVTICAQVWTTRNLEVTTYSDGTPIPEVTDPTAWANLTTGAWCYYNNDSANGTTYGKLYNWYAVAGIYDVASLTNVALRKILAPTGWHVPTDAEWTTLTTCLGGEIVAGGKMKESGTTHWNHPNTNATNTSGFTSLPGGSCDSSSSGSFYYVGYYGYWWSSTELNTSYGWFRTLYYYNGYATRDNFSKRNGYSVRCLRD
ncbi:MAG: fibrobacter succinogenes major paralogous domain-containing protein [Burkholderiales bacterium]|nr:fibrobacter succinogenes major paralogous domain-containing protein [Flavobacterium sp.]